MLASTYRLLASLLASMLLCAGSAGASTLVIEGAGDGHGVGMSQEGALGYAEHGWSYSRILAHYYTGTELGQAPANAKVRVLVGSTVKTLALESYVRGVISAEMPAEWPAAALQAQAVAVRTYALTAHAGDGSKIGQQFDVYSDTRSQVYRGPSAETASTNAAALATAGQIVTYGGQPAITYFFASSGGHTEDAQNAFPGALAEPWLVGVLDQYDQGPLHSWKLSLSFAAAGKRLGGLVKGAFRGIEVLRRGSSPRILSAYVLGSGGRTLTPGGELAERLGLYDTWAYFSVKRGTNVKAEPDHSGQPGASAAPAPASSAPSVPATPEGGAQGPAEAPEGGVQAPPASPASTPAGGVAAE
jgi:SpoIID/LytB domain protein